MIILKAYHLRLRTYDHTFISSVEGDSVIAFETEDRFIIDQYPLLGLS
jgi:hypothetical protein